MKFLRGVTLICCYIFLLLALGFLWGNMTCVSTRCGAGIGIVFLMIPFAPGVLAAPLFSFLRKPPTNKNVAYFVNSAVIIVAFIMLLYLFLFIL
jgi:hypothetical protein